MAKTKAHLPYFDDFLLSMQVDNRSPETLYNYERDLNVFQNFLAGASINFEKVDKKAILNYKAYLTSFDRATANDHKTQKRLSSYSINRMLSVLRSYLKFLIKMDYNSPIDPSAIELVRKEKRQARVGELDEIIKLIESPAEFEKDKLVASRNRAILETLFATGMRISELINLKTASIDKTGRVFILGKGKKERFAYLTPRAIKYIKEYLEVRGGNASPYLFIPFKGRNSEKKDTKLSANYLQEKIKKYREFLGLNIPVSAHGLRHGFATYMAENGASVAALQILLGHESLDTTTRYVNASAKYAEKIHRQFHPLKD
ncbi:MAG: tyrosine-type recombinase/integrase [Patescibacteria group bacterium]